MPFPFSLNDFFEIEFPVNAAVHPVADLTAAISDWLAEQRAGTILQTSRGIAFKAGVFRAVTGWNILVPISSGEIEIARYESVIRVTYRLRFTELLIIATAFVAFVAVFYGAATPFGTVATFVAGWLWLFGMNYLLARYRIPRALRRIAQRATGGKFA